MRTFSPPGAPPITDVDAERVETALSVMGRKWTTWVAQTLAAQHEPMRVRDIASRIPAVSEHFVSRRLVQMHADGLVVRADDRRGAPYRLSAIGEQLAPVHQELADWSLTYLDLGTTARAARIEDALDRLHLRHTTAVIQALTDGPLRLVHLSEAIGLDTPAASQRLLRLQTDGLVTRTGPRFGDPYTLTTAGAALSPVYAAVEHWASPTTALSPAAPTRSTSRRDPDDARATAALGRSPAVYSGLFSHAPQPQPPVPASVTAQAAPARTR
jgi:DNA-binding HxlR family transcriptional regulator